MLWSPQVYYGVRSSEPQKPHNPVLLTKYGDIKSVLATGLNENLQPVLNNKENLPGNVQERCQTSRPTVKSTRKATIRSM